MLGNLLKLVTICNQKIDICKLIFTVQVQYSHIHKLIMILLKFVKKRHISDQVIYNWKILNFVSVKA